MVNDWEGVKTQKDKSVPLLNKGEDCVSVPQRMQISSNTLSSAPPFIQKIKDCLVLAL